MKVEDRKSKLKPSSSKLNALSFFSGAMGLDIGLHEAGIQTLLACEVDSASRETININAPEMGLIGDIRAYSTQEILEFAGVKDKSQIDIIAGGPPCQAFSSAGKRMGLADDRGNVFLKFIEVIEEIRPRYAVIENVRGLLSSAYSINLEPEEEKFLPSELVGLKGSTLYYVLNRLRHAGYNVSFNLYNSANYGSPQVRERVIIICTLDEVKVPHLTPTHSQNTDLGLKPWRTLKAVIEDIQGKTIPHVKFSEKRLKYFKMLKAGQNWRNLPEETQKEALGNSYHLGGGKTGFFRRLSWDKPSPTLVTHPAMPATELGHPVEDRPLNVLEYKRIQEFPDDWQIQGSLINQYKQIGNAVPVSVGKAIGKMIISHSKGENLPEFKNFKFSRYKNTSEEDFEREFILQAKKLLRSKEPTLFG